MNPTLLSNNVEMPHDDAAERTLLSAALVSQDSFAEMVSSIRWDDFFNPQHRLIYSAMRLMFDSSMPIEPVGLVDMLKSRDELNLVGGADAILGLAGDMLSMASWKTSAEIVKRDRVLRDMVYASAEIASLATSSPKDTSEVVEKAEGLLLSVTDGVVSGNSSTVMEMMDDLYNTMCTYAENGVEEGVRTGFPGLDRMTLGLRSGQMVVVGARPGVGKTSLCLNLAVNMARNSTTVAMFSLEMSREEIAQRLLSSRSGIPLTAIRSCHIRPDQWETVVDSISDLRELPIVVDDTSGTNVTEIRAKARRMLHGVKDGVVIIDYLQLMSGAKGESRAAQVGEMSRGIKVMAKDLGYPVIALSQLNREVEGRTGKRPQLSDLRESGSIEQDADIVLLLDRSMTAEEAERKDRPDEGVTDLIVAKNRSGPLGTIHMMFDGRTTRFLEMAGERWT